MQNLFNSKLQSLNDSQLEAVKSKENILVLAGAGSGKTTMATIKVGGFLYNGSLSKDILMMTFTNKAANEMAERISKLHVDGKDVTTSTFHAFCIQYIRNNLEFVGKKKGFVIVDDKDQESILNILCKDDALIGTQGFRVLNKDKGLSNKISKFKDTLTSFNIEEESLNKVFSEAEKLVFKWYEDKLRYMNGIDFADIIRYAIASMKENVFTIPSFEHIVIDEFQDTNSSQLELTTLLGNQVIKNGTITVVGDDDQAIYQWRGANPSGMRTFVDSFNANVIKLEHNYRSSDFIVNAANALIKNNVNRLGKNMIPVLSSNSLIDVVTSENMHDEASYIVSKIAKTISETDDDVAILYRTNRYSRSIENELNSHGIIYKMYKGLEFVKRAEINLTKKILHLSVNPRDLVAMECVLKHFCSGIGASTVNKINNYIESSGMGNDEIYHGEGIPLKGKSLKQFLWVMNITKQMSRIALRDIPNFIATAHVPSINSDWENISYDDCEYADFSKKSEFCVDNLMNRISTFPADKGEGSKFKMRMENVDELLCWIYSYADKDGLRDLDGFVQSMSIDASETNEDDLESPRVHLMTVHGSKGLEFDNVYILGCVKGMFPGLKREETTYDAMEESRRLFYVAMTRAKKELCLTVPESLPYGSVEDHRPSMFIDEIDNYTNRINLSEERDKKAYYKMNRHY